jgi:putative glycosyltransferase (TIGR04372 family)
MSFLNRFFILYLKFTNKRKKEGNVVAFKYVIKLIFAFFIACFIICLRPIIKIKLIPLHTEALGHHALHTDLLLFNLERKHSNRTVKIIYYNMTPRAQLPNQQLHLMWSRVIPILPFLIFYNVDRFLIKMLGQKYQSKPIDELTSKYIKTLYSRDILDASKPRLSFTKAEQNKAHNILAKMGIPLDAKFICLHVRDDAYYKFNDCYTKMTAFRNADITSYKKAAIFLANLGYYVVRMGKVTNKHFDVKNNKIIDYANSSFRSDLMDIYLSAHCYFFMSTSCGLDTVAHIFRRPILATNVTPLTFFDSSYQLLLAKKIIKIDTNEIISFQEQQKIFKIFSIYHFNKMLNMHGLKLIDNSEDEIFEATKEMLLRMEGKWQDTEISKALQKKFLTAMPVELLEYCDEPDGSNYLRSIPLYEFKGKYSTIDLLNNKSLLE